MSTKERMKAFFYFMLNATKKALAIDCDVVLATSTDNAYKFGKEQYSLEVTVEKYMRIFDKLFKL